MKTSLLPHVMSKRIFLSSFGYVAVHIKKVVSVPVAALILAWEKIYILKTITVAIHLLLRSVQVWMLK